MSAAMIRPGHAICAAVLALALSDLAVAQTAGPPAQGEQHAAPAKKSRKAVAKKGEGAAAQPSPEVAERLIESASKALQAGKAETATHQLTRVIGTSGLATPIMARALYLRGQAFRKQGKPAQAISDLTSAIWLKGGLNDAERADALQQRIAAYRDAGLSDPGLVDPKSAGAPAPKVAAGAPSAAPAPGPVLSAAPDAAPAQQSGGFLSSLFGGSQSQQPAAAAPPPPPPPVTSAVPQTGSAWSSHTAVVPAPTGKVVPPKGKRVASAPPADSPPPKVAAGGRLKIQVASVKTREEAEALAARIRREHAAALGARQTEIDSANLGAFGTLFRVRIGTFAVAEETRDLCQRLKSSGLDCMVVAR